MKIELICIGTELLEGKPNTNVSFVGDRIFALGFNLSRAVTVEDSKPRIEEAFKEAIARADVIISTGGLGSTFDDLTVEALAAAIGRKTYLNTDVLSHIEKHFASRNMQMPSVNKKQAHIIEGAKIVENKIGTAPGQIIELQDKIVFLLPGPPRELHPMFEASVSPYLRKRVTKLRKSVTLHVFGLTESAVEEKIEKIVSDESVVDRGVVNFTILAHHGMVDIKISAGGADELLIDETLHNLKKEFVDVLGDYLYGYDNETLESVVGNLLMKNKLTLSVAESCTGGMLSSRIINIPGSSHYFVEGLTVYSDEAKMKRLGLKNETLQKYGAVSREAAEEMLNGLKEIAASYCSIAVTGIAGPGGATPEKPVGLVYIGVQTPLSRTISEFRFYGSRNEIRERASLTALDLLRRELMKFK